MREEFKLLVALQDLDIMIKEVEEKKTSDQLKDMGFQLDGLEPVPDPRRR